jgi:hypothetical protein
MHDEHSAGRVGPTLAAMLGGGLITLFSASLVIGVVSDEPEIHCGNGGGAENAIGLIGGAGAGALALLAICFGLAELSSGNPTRRRTRNVALLAALLLLIVAWIPVIACNAGE